MGEGIGEFVVEFDGHEFGDSVYEDASERAFAGAYLKYLVGVCELSGGYDSPLLYRSQRGSSGRACFVGLGRDVC